LCDAWTKINLHSSQIAQNTSAITALQNAIPPVLTVSSCLMGSIQDIDVVLETLETQFCDYKTILGSTSQLTSSYAAPKVVCVTGSTKQLVNPKQTMSSLTAWAPNPTTLAENLQNLWATVCDIRQAVSLILTTCCQVSCENVILRISYKWIDKDTLRLFFTGTSLPIGFYDCGGETVLTLTDGLGNVATTVGLMLRDADPSIKQGILDDPFVDPLYHFDVTTLGGLDVTKGIVISADACFTNGDTSCIKCISLNIIPFVDAGCCVLTATVPTTITYKICYTPATTTTTTTTTP